MVSQTFMTIKHLYFSLKITFIFLYTKSDLQNRDQQINFLKRFYLAYPGIFLYLIVVYILCKLKFVNQKKPTIYLFILRHC